MEKTLLDISEFGLTPGLASTLLQLLVVLFTAMSIRSWMSNLVARRLAYRRVRAYRHLTEGCWIQLSSAKGAIMGQVKRISTEEVVLETEDTFEHIPILQFDNGRKSILKVSPIKET